MRYVKKVEIVFENCEVIEIDQTYFYSFIIEDLKTDISRRACNAIGRSTTAGTCAFAIDKNADGTYHPFGTEEADGKIFERINRWQDITSLVLHYEDCTEETIFVCYDEGEHEGTLGAPNINQKTYLSDSGNLFITIAAGKDIKDFFEEDILEIETFPKML